MASIKEHSTYNIHNSRSELDTAEKHEEEDDYNSKVLANIEKKAQRASLERKIHGSEEQRQSIERPYHPKEKLKHSSFPSNLDPPSSIHEKSVLSDISNSTKGESVGNKKQLLRDLVDRELQEANALMGHLKKVN
mmetsp:Transcript_9917/g.9802  ORF Transcript_9917/g.9802 Transcript_9917/m.9802 type:complete len:135 (-) Transcript_9917:36-440(-)